MQRTALALGITAFAALALACGGAGSGGGTSKRPESRRAEPDRITMDKYNALRTGMSYSEAVDILGRDGEEASSNELGGTRTVMYVWKNPGGANMNAMFQNDKLVSKAQFGLK